MEGYRLEKTFGFKYVGTCREFEDLLNGYVECVLDQFATLKSEAAGKIWID